ncbi:MAG: hypothetical protein Q4G61_07325 [Tissierellia bacterium]|nr:hypothetical protein [Tissierellia bacterium]
MKKIEMQRQSIIAILMGFVGMSILAWNMDYFVTREFHLGYAGAYWMMIPLFLGVLYMTVVGKMQGKERKLKGQPIGAWMPEVLIACLKITAIAVLPLLLFTAVTSLKSLPGVLLGSGIFLLSAGILTGLGILLRLFLHPFVAYPVMVVLTAMGILRGALSIILGNIGGGVATAGDLLIKLAPPIGRITYMAKDAAGLIPIEPIRWVQPIVYILFVLIILALLIAQIKNWKRLGLAILSLFLLYMGMNYSNHRIDGQTKSAFDRAIQITDHTIWPGYALGDIQFALRDGKEELFFTADSEPVRRPETIPVLAYTATLVDDVATLHVLDYEQTRGLYDVIGMDSLEGTMDSYISVLAHEGFHGFQFSKLGEEGMDLFFGMSDYVTLGAELNQDPVYKELWGRELDCIYEYLVGEQPLVEYLKAREKRESHERELLSPEDFAAYRHSQESMELLEGTARYAEMMSMPGELRENRHFQSLKSNPTGAERYYLSGMGRCLILDQEDPDWKENFDFTTALMVE